MKRNSEPLKVLAKCKPKLRQAILKAADDDLFEAIRQCLLNIWFETVKLKPKTAKKLAPYSAHIKFAADKRNPISHRRRCLVQKGEGFLPFLLTSVFEILVWAKEFAAQFLTTKPKYPVFCS